MGDFEPNSYFAKIGSVYLLGCDCGEVGCWPLSAHIETEGESVKWTTFHLPISQDAELVLDKAVSLADGHGCDFVRTEHLLLALTAITTSHAAAILQEAGISLGRLEEIVDALPRTEQQEGTPSSIEDLLPEL